MSKVSLIIPEVIIQTVLKTDASLSKQTMEAYHWLFPVNQTEENKLCSE